ncbi:hypothetical protein ACMFMG_000017 [Clarireedia jacksonii]
MNTEQSTRQILVCGTGTGTGTGPVMDAICPFRTTFEQIVLLQIPKYLRLVEGNERLYEQMAWQEESLASQQRLPFIDEEREGEGSRLEERGVHSTVSISRCVE